MHELPLAEIKVCRTLTQGVLQSREYAAVAQAIISLASNLDVKVIAASVESRSVVAALQAMDCQLAQGSAVGGVCTLEQLLTLDLDEDARQSAA